MSTHWTPILGWQAVPDSSGQCYFERYDVAATNDVWKHLVLILNDNGSTKTGIYGLFTVPKNYISAPKIVILWTAIVTTGNAKFQYEYRTVPGDDANSLDQAGLEETVTVTDAAPGAVNRRLQASITITAANVAADEVVEFYFNLRGDDAATTIASKCIIHDLLFEYADV